MRPKILVNMPLQPASASHGELLRDDGERRSRLSGSALNGHVQNPMLSLSKDGCGSLIYAHYHGLPSFEIVERDDGWLDVSTGAPAYFAPFEKWPTCERQAMSQVRGRVLDVGCGAGRVALHLQARGHQVVAIDLSPLAVKTCRLRGVRDARVCSITQVSRRLGEFDTIVMFGNNFGLFGNPRRARWLLRRFYGLTSSTARIVAESRNPYETTNPNHRRYLQLNRRRGRFPGQLRLRVGYGHARTPWFDYLIVSPREMRAIVAGTGWRVARLIRATGPLYIGVLEKVVV
jgi:SAM-dependent methyltransferase